MELFLHCTAEWGQNQDCTLHCPEFLNQMRRTRWKSEASRHLIEKQLSAYLGENQQYAIKKQQSSLFNIKVAVFLTIPKMPFLFQSQNLMFLFSFFCLLFNKNKTKVFRAELLDVALALDFFLKTV